MKKNLSRFLTFTITSLFLVIPFTTSISAQEPDDNANLLCRVFPFVGKIGFADSLCGTGDSVEGQAETVASNVAQLIQFGLSLVFIGIIGIAIFTIIKAAIKYIRSEGDESKIEESTKAIKAVFLGIGALIVGIIGLVIILAIFNASGAVNTPDAPNLI